MRTKEFISERINRTESNELVIFDIDDTLLHTTAKINVVKDGEIVRSLTNQEFNNYKLQPGEEFDFGEFRDARKFEEESLPIGPMLDKLRDDLAAGKNVVMLTARADFDNQKAVWRTFKRHGIDINNDVHLFRAGNIAGPQSPAVKKALHVSRWLRTGKYNRVVMYDDSTRNLSVFKKLEKRFPQVEFEAHHVSDEGNTKQVESNVLERRKKVKRALWGPGPFGLYGVDVGYSGDGGMAEGKFRSNSIEEFKPSKEALNDLKSKYLPDWEMLDHRILQAKYVAKDHRHAEQFIKFINKLSERMDHFAEVTQDVAEVTVKTTTFDVKGLTLLDFQLAMIIDNAAKKNAIEQVRMSGNFGMHDSLDEFAPAGSGSDKPPRGPKTPGRDSWGGDSGEDPYSRPEPEYYSRSIDFFGKFESDHFDDEVFDKKTGVFKGYWDDEEGRVQIAYFKFDDPRKTGSDDPGMGWYYEPQNESMQEDAETPDRETHLVRKLGRLGQRVVQNLKLWNKYAEAVDNENIDWIISLIQEGTGADKSEVMRLSNLFGEIGGGLGRITDFAWAVKEGTWVEDFLEPYIEYRKQQGLGENFADGRNPQDKGDSKRHGVPTKASVSTLRKVAKQGGRKGQLAHWMANMKSGRAKAKKN